MYLDFFKDINANNKVALDYNVADAFIVDFSWWNASVLSAYAGALYFLQPAATFPSPFAWRVVSLLEVVAVICMAWIACVLIAVARISLRNHYLWRVIATNLLFVFSYLFIYISGGAIEWHFHFFIVLATLVVWADWRLGWIGVVAVALHHSVLNFIAPHWVYHYGRHDVAYLMHALLVLAMVVVTTLLSEKMRLGTIGGTRKQEHAVGLKEILLLSGAVIAVLLLMGVFYAFFFTPAISPTLHA